MQTGDNNFSNISQHQKTSKPVISYAAPIGFAIGTAAGTTIPPTPTYFITTGEVIPTLQIGQNVRVNSAAPHYGLATANVQYVTNASASSVARQRV